MPTEPPIVSRLRLWLAWHLPRRWRFVRRWREEEEA